MRVGGVVLVEARQHFAERHVRAPAARQRKARLVIGLRLAPQLCALAQPAQSEQQRRILVVVDEPALGGLELVRRIRRPAIGIQRDEIGIPVRIDYRWFIVFGLSVWLIAINLSRGGMWVGQVKLLPVSVTAAWILAIVATLGLFLSVFGHELSHALMGRAEGIDIEEIVLHPFGGLARLRNEPESPGAEFRIAVAGPAAADLTRLALSPYDIWRDIFATNAEPIDAALSAFIARLEEVRKQLRSSELEAVFSQAAASARALRGGK